VIGTIDTHTIKLSSEGYLEKLECSIVVIRKGETRCQHMLYVFTIITITIIIIIQSPFNMILTDATIYTCRIHHFDAVGTFFNPK
jgi:hypothetical protein